MSQAVSWSLWQMSAPVVVFWRWWDLFYGSAQWKECELQFEYGVLYQSSVIGTVGTDFSNFLS